MTEENKTQILGKKIIILGCPGSGKSTLARKLHDKTGIPLFHLDNLWWKEDRTHISREAFDEQLEAILQGEEWIIDGDYSRTYEPRFRSCDTVIFLDYSEDECREGIIGRIGQERPDIPWTENSLDPELMDQVKRYRTENRPEVYKLIKTYPDRQLLIFETRAQTDEWLSEQTPRRIDIVGSNYSGGWDRMRSACRAVVIRDGMILLCHESRTDLWMIPGGGQEEQENEEACCIRETAEETGYVISIRECILEISEYYEDWKYLSRYYLAETAGRCDRKLTEREAHVGMEAVWLRLEEAREIFAKHASYADQDEMKRGIYLREYQALCSLFQSWK